MNDFIELALGLFAPMPRVFKRRDLRLALVPLGRFEQEIVVALGVERRIKVDQVNGFVREVVAQDVKVVAEEKLIHVREIREARRRRQSAALWSKNAPSPNFQSVASSGHLQFCPRVESLGKIFGMQHLSHFTLGQHAAVLQQQCVGKYRHDLLDVMRHKNQRR